MAYKKHFVRSQTLPENAIDIASRSSRRRVVIRCRKCWEDVAIQSGADPVLPCPKCNKEETYVHALLPGKKRSEN